MDLVYFVYGQAFVLMAVALLVTRRRSSPYTLAKHFMYLACFGLLHGALEWTHLWQLLHGKTPWLEAIGPWLMLLSFVVLLEFGRRVLRDGCPQAPGDEFICASAVPLAAYGALALAIGGSVQYVDYTSTDFQIVVRYAACLPASWLAAIALLRYYRNTLAPAMRDIRQADIKHPIYALSASLFAYGVLAGVVVPASDWFPASSVNQDSFFALTGVYVQVARALCAVLMAWATLSVLRQFRGEQERTLHAALASAKAGQIAAVSEQELLRKNQALVIQAEVAKASTQAKADILAKVSHEIRNPLNGVVGMTEILQKSALQAEQRRMLDVIHKSSLSMLILLNDILDYSKIEAGKLDIESIPTRIRDVAELALSLVQASLHNKDVSLSLHVDPDVPHWVMSDPMRMQQVLLNLLGNAAKFSQGNLRHRGAVSLVIARCKLANGSEGLSMCIEDNGMGMSQSTVDKLFTPFEQGQSHIAREFGGTGLGLNISHQLVKLMGGTISVQSTEREGSKFTVLLPLKLCDSPSAQMKAVAQTAARTGEASLPTMLRPRILVAEDDEANQDIFQQQLQLLGCDVAVAANGLEALALWQNEPFAMLLTDCHMPLMDGLQLTSTIRQAERGTPRHIPIFAVTGDAQDEERRRCLEGGMDGYLTKPVRLDDLAKLLSSWLALPAPMDGDIESQSP